MPSGLKAGGKKLWTRVLDDFELAEHETNVLRETARTIDLIDDLVTIVKKDGSMQESPQGRRVYPAVQELRQQRIALARLLAALNIPTDDDGSRPVRGPRGVYGIQGTA